MVLSMGKSKHIFNTIFFSILTIYTLYNAIAGTIRLINNQYGSIAANTIQETISPILIIITIFIHMILPLILIVTLIFHFIAFFKNDLDAKPFNYEFNINLILTICFVLSMLFIWFLIKTNSEEAGMILALPAVAGVIALISSVIIFYYGFIKFKNN